MDFYAQNETSSECFGAQTFAQQKGAGNGSMGTSNITCSNTSTILIPQRVRQRGEGYFIISFRGSFKVATMTPFCMLFSL